MGTLYSEHRTWLHGWAAGWKLAAVALWGLALVWVRDLGWMAAAAAASALIYLSLGPAMRPARAMMLGVVVAAAMVAGFHALWGQWQAGALSALRLLGASTLGASLVVSTRMGDVARALEALLWPLARLGLRVDLLALQLALMLRFVEHFFVQWHKLNAAHRLKMRGASGGIRLIAPLAVQMLLTAKKVGDALFIRLGR